MSTDRRCGAAAEPATSREFVSTLTFPVGAPASWVAGQVVRLWRRRDCGRPNRSGTPQAAENVNELGRKPWQTGSEVRPRVAAEVRVRAPCMAAGKGRRTVPHVTAPACQTRSALGGRPCF